MDPREQTGTQTAIYIPQDEGKSLWILGDLLTFKVHEESESVAIFELEVPPESAVGPHLHRSQDETHYVLEGQFELLLGERKVSAAVGSMVYVPRTTVHAFATQEHRRARSCLSRGLQDRWSSSSKRPVSRLATPLRPQKVRRTWINCRPVPSERAV